MATTYVQLTREEFEEWLGTLGHRWKLKAGKVGIYVVSLSERVAIEISSSMTGRDDVVSKAQASMGVKLVSLINGFVLNKKAQEQSHVKRTTNWRDNLRKVFDRMLDAYRRSESFYEALAEIENREEYQIATLAKIEKIPGWASNQFMSDLHTRVSGGGILTHRQLESLDKAAAPRQRPQEDALPRGTDLLPFLRGLWAVAKQENDTTAMKAAQSAGEAVKSGRPLQVDDMRHLRVLLRKYKDGVDEWMRTRQEKPQRVAARWTASQTRGQSAT